MSHNYSKHFNNKQNEKMSNVSENVESLKTVENLVEETNNVSIEETVEETVEETITIKQYINGVVSGCEKLNVRKGSSKESDVLCIIDKDSEVQIDNSENSEEFYKVITTSGVEGYCMKKFISLK